MQIHVANALIGFLLLGDVATVFASAPHDGSRGFDVTVAPILARRCLDCQSGSDAKGKLDLSKRGAALAGGKSGRAIVPGKVGESLLWERVEADEMPPKSPLCRQPPNVPASYQPPQHGQRSRLRPPAGAVAPALSPLK